MLKQEIINLSEKVHPAFIVAIFFITTVDAVIFIRINHQVKLFTIIYHSLDEFHAILVMDVVVAAAMT